ncbi:unnamed protein product [Cylicostephanus goldi]|uniref:DUF4440 domain-containing protein n=1 Tax=Cylicostephanus goldi TaxID=71465 RepID=A0A3P6S1N6_CYLGO|nr:unnamed protein product [Cylicostephanus goldi]
MWTKCVTHQSAMGSSEEAKTILTPILAELRKQREARNYEKVSEFYDLNAVHVHAGKEALSNEKFDMAGDFIIFTADYETETEKIGVLKGKFTQIWRKANDSYLILHIEYAPQ